MNKKLICLILSLLMVVTCFVGCGKESDQKAIDDVNKKASESAKTLSMYLLCEKELSADQATAIEEAVNKITKSQFKTQLEMYFYTEDKYYDALEVSFAARAAAEESGSVTNKSEDDETATDETFINEWGITEIKYPTIDSYQVDIFYVGGYEKFLQYNDEGLLSRLDEELSSSSKLLNDYISPAFLSYMKSMNSGTYALPTNTVIGEYTYLLLNKDVLAKTRYNSANGIAKFTSLTCEATQDVLAQVKTELSDYVPLYSCLGEDGLAVSDFKYWGVDENGVPVNEFSVIGSPYPSDAAYKTEESYMGSVGNIFSQADFSTQVKTLKKYKVDGYFGTEKDLEDGKVAVAYVKGGAELVTKYADNYEAVVIGVPTIETEDLYRNMFAVADYTSDLTRSMEILTYLNTNEDFRNLILYGIEGENYEMVESDYVDENGEPYMVVRRLNDNYMMDVNKTGNTLLAYTLEGDDPTLGEYIKQQNLDSVVSLTMGFAYYCDGMPVDPNHLRQTRELSASVKERLMAATYENVDDVINELKAEISNAPYVSSLLRKVAPVEMAETCSLGYAYEQWGISMKIYDPEAAE